MKYNLRRVENQKILHIELPKLDLKNSKFMLIIKDLSGRILVNLEGLSLPNDIRLNNLESGKYIMTIIAGTQFFSELITA